MRTFHILIAIDTFFCIIKSMAKLHFFTTGYTGKLGATYGSRSKRQSIIKAIPFSHRPHNEKQAKAFYAFGCLNRFSAYVAKTFWYYLGLSDRKMLRHNAVAQFFKPCVSQSLFSLDKLSEVIKSDNSIVVSDLNIDYGAGEVRCTLTAEPLSITEKKARVFFAVVDNDGRVLCGANLPCVTQTIDLQFLCYNFSSLEVVAFKSATIDKKVVLSGFYYSGHKPNPIQEHILYTSFLALSPTAQVQDSTVDFGLNNFTVQNNTAVFL